MMTAKAAVPERPAMVREQELNAVSEGVACQLPSCHPAPGNRFSISWPFDSRLKDRSLSVDSGA
jgi:hypothetical protein